LSLVLDVNNVKEWTEAAVAVFSNATRIETASAVETFQEGDRKFAKFFLISSEENLKHWQVTPESIERRIRTFIGMPFVSEPELRHFGTDDMPLDKVFEIQERYRAGTIIDVQLNPQTMIAFAIVEFENNELGLMTWKELMEGKAVYVSPAIAGSGVRRNGVNLYLDWFGIHLARVASPAYGVFHASIKATCEGGERECVRNLLATASVFISSNDSFNIEGFSCSKNMSQKPQSTSTATEDEDLKKQVAAIHEDMKKIKTAFEALDKNEDTDKKPDPPLEKGQTTPVTDPIVDPQNRKVVPGAAAEDDDEMKKEVASMKLQLASYEKKAASASLTKLVEMKQTAGIYANAAEEEEDKKKFESATEDEIEKEIASITPIIAKIASMNEGKLQNTPSRLISQVASASSKDSNKITSLQDLRDRGMI